MRSSLGKYQKFLIPMYLQFSLGTLSDVQFVQRKYEGKDNLSCGRLSTSGFQPQHRAKGQDDKRGSEPDFPKPVQL